MPPKKKSNATAKADGKAEEKIEAKTANEEIIVNEAAGKDKSDSQATRANRFSIEALLDQRLQQQTKIINDLFTKFTDATKSDLDTIKARQEFISSKFDELNNTVDNLKSANHDLRSQNEQLKRELLSLRLMLQLLTVTWSISRSIFVEICSKYMVCLINYKFVWTSNGKVFLRKNNSQTSQVHSFVSMEKFEEFKSRIG
jgi:predicted RNase H-like nuclease (RuvC/YqgF family)